MTFSLSDILTKEEFQSLKSVNNTVALADLFKRLLLNTLLVWIMLQSSQFDFFCCYFFGIYILFSTNFGVMLD